MYKQQKMETFKSTEELDDRKNELNKCKADLEKSTADLEKITVLISQATGDLGSPQVQQPPLCFVEVLAWQADALAAAEGLQSVMLAFNKSMEDLSKETQGLRTRIESGAAAPSLAH